MILRFREPFWDDASFVRERAAGRDTRLARPDFVHDPRAAFPTWWVPSPARAPVLVGWAGGPAAERLAGLAPAAVVARSLEALAGAMAVPLRSLERRLEAWREHDWQRDPCTLGAYTYVAVGGTGAPQALARPLDATLFFAGEATDADAIGTVDGALASGRRAAQRLLASL